MNEAIDRQLVGFAGTVAVTAVLTAYLILCALPPFLWSRNSYYHPIWRGVESFVCYVLAALVLGAIFAATSDDEWSVFSGMAAGGAAWARIGSILLLLLVFIAASWWGGKTAAGRRRRIKSKNRRRSRAAAA